MKTESSRVALLLTGLFLSVCLSTPSDLFAVPARTAPEDLRQPDGSAITVRQFGDEWSNGLRTPDGYTILKDERSGYWMFAEDAPGGGVRRSNRIVGRHAPTGLRRFLHGAPSRAPALAAEAAPSAPPSLAANLGSQPLLVIFADLTPSVRVGSTAESLYNKFFGAIGSVKHYYETVSYGNFSIVPAPENNVALDGLVNDGIVSVTLNYPHPNTGSAVDNRNRNIARDALMAADPYVDFSQFDSNGDGILSPAELHIIIVVAGYERSYTSNPCGAAVWGHRWVLSGSVPAPTLDGKSVGLTYAQFGEWHCSSGSPPGHEATIGIMAHELGHDLGLPDLYDTDGSSRGLGGWSIMAGGSWNGVGFAGDSPAHFDPWSKYFQGWVSPIVVTDPLVNVPISSSATTPNIYQLRSGTTTSGEYFLVENRQRENYDATIPGTGLVIWHVDAAQTHNNIECFPGGPSCASGHYLTAVVPADNLFNLERNQNGGDGGDPWPGTSGNTSFTATSSPNSNLYSGAASGVSVTGISASAVVMTATLSGAGNAPPETIINGSPQAPTRSTSADFTFTSTQANSTFACKLDEGAFAACTSPTSYTGLAGGSHIFQVAATDQNNNTDPTPASFAWTVDTTPPDTNLTAQPPSPSSSASATFQFTATESNSTFECKIDSGAFESCSSPKTYNGLANGSHTFQARAIDQAGNVDPTPASVTFLVASGPTILAAPTSLLPSGTVTGTWSGIVNPTPQDWIGLYLLGSGSGSFRAWAYVSCAATPGTARTSGSCGLAVPSNAPSGDYELRLFANDGFSVLATSNIFTVESGAVLPAVSIQATANGAEPATNGQFTITRTGSTANALTVSFSVGGTATAGAGNDYANLGNSVVIPANAASVALPVLVQDDSVVEGTETVVVMLSSNAAYAIGSANSAAVTISDNEPPPAGPLVTAVPSPVSRGGTVSVSWSGITTPTVADWIGLYLAGSSGDSFRSWAYTSSCSTSPSGAARSAGSCPLSVPVGIAAGSYEVRLLANDGFHVIVSSAPLAVQ